MAYSAITNSGLILLAFSLFTYESIFSGVLYLVVYLFSTFGVFYAFFITRLKQFNSNELIDFRSFNCLKIINPCLVFLLSINFLSMAGIPPLAGFISKFLIFSSVIEANNLKLLLSLIILSLISAFYYIRPIKQLVFTASKQPKFLAEVPFNAASILVLIFFLNGFLILQPRLVFCLIESILNSNFFIL